MVDFIGGSNWQEEPKMAKEYWFEMLPHEPDGREIFAHEVIECLCMQLGNDYDRAHDYANACEAIIRGNVANG